MLTGRHQRKSISTANANEKENYVVLPNSSGNTTVDIYDIAIRVLISLSNLRIILEVVRILFFRSFFHLDLSEFDEFVAFAIEPSSPLIGQEVRRMRANLPKSGL
jgi:hypothetical protein